MKTLKNLARLAAATVLAAGVFAGGSGLAEAAPVAGHHHKIVVTPTTGDDGSGGGGITVQMYDTGWG
jgi:hypothetical protein